MKQIINLFLTKSRLNYTFFIFLLLLGIVSYQTIPKDVYPPIKLKKIFIIGDYAGASINAMDKMIVTNLEKDLKAINGVQKIESFIKNGEFTIILNLEEGSNNINILNKAKDIVANNKSNFPKDMDEPTTSILEWSFPLINVTISSNKVDKQKLIDVAEQIRNKISSIPNIAKVSLYEDTTRVYEIILDDEKIKLYNLDKQTLFDEIKSISYIYPLGKIEDNKEHLYLSTINGNKSVEEYLNNQIKINDKTIYLSDIAKVEKRYKPSDVISKLNGKFDVQLAISKNDKANAIDIAKKVKDEISKINKQYQDIDVDTFADTSIYIEDRLNTIISGIMFGLILVAIALYLLINKRVAFIVVMGIPTAILLGVVVLSFTPYSINMITLIGALLIIGVLVDDAVIITENIQRHMQLGDDKLKAALDGTTEVLLPVIASSFTTVLAFLPMMVLTNELGQFLLMIPIAVIVLIIASLIESLIFLPIHSLHILNNTDKELDWTKAQDFYEKILIKVIKYRKVFLIFFILGIPLITIVVISQMKFQMFPDSDGDRLFIQGEFTSNQSVNETFEKTKPIEKILLEHKDELGIKNISFGVGYQESDEDVNFKTSIFQFHIELHSRIPENFVNEYINPILSFENSENPKLRKYSIDEIVEKLNILLKDYNPKGLQSFIIKKQGEGITAHDIEILLNSKDKKLLLESIFELKEVLKSIDGVYSIDDTAKFGLRELKLKLNSYGESLGFSEALIASSISSLYLKVEQTKGLNENGIFEVLTYSVNRDNLEAFKNLELNIPYSQKLIALKDICDFIYIQNFESIKKVNNQDVKMVYANVHNHKITAIEVLDKLKPLFEKYENLGISISLEGEQEQNKQMEKEMSYAFFIAIFLIFLVLLMMFNSFKLVLIILSIIPFSILGALIGHLVIGMNLTLTSIVGILGLAGVVINDTIIMVEFMKKNKTLPEIITSAKLRLRPIFITSITTFLGLSTLIFYATGQSVILQPIAISLGFGLIWGTILTLLYVPAIFAVSQKIKK